MARVALGLVRTAREKNENASRCVDRAHWVAGTDRCAARSPRVTARKMNLSAGSPSAPPHPSSSDQIPGSTKAHLWCVSVWASSGRLMEQLYFFVISVQSYTSGVFPPAVAGLCFKNDKLSLSVVSFLAGARCLEFISLLLGRRASNCGERMFQRMSSSWKCGR